MLQVCLSCFSKVNADTTSVNADTISDNLIKFENWQGLTYGKDPGDCCSSISGSGALGDTNTDTILFSYGTDILYQTIAIQQALQASGIEVNGYQYGWTFRMISNNGRGGDTLEFEVTVKDSNGNEVERQTYNQSSPLQDSWITESGAHYFASPYLDPQNIQLKITGRDGGFWGGYYGPEVKDVDLRLIYSANPCASNPLYDPSCSGYADALAQQEYDNNCSANALYDSGCPGYANAYYTQQCSINPLYDSGCPGYEQAYYDQQCSNDPLYDTGCPGYAEAFYDQQCTADPLYDSGCPGYAEAYHDQQCGLNTLYANTCPGYAEAYFDQQCGLDVFYDAACPGYAEAVVERYVTPNEEAEVAEIAEPTTIETVVDAESFTEVAVTGDAVIDDILGDLNEIPDTTLVMEDSPMETVPTLSEVEETIQEVETVEETDSTGELEELVNVAAEEESSEDTETQDGGGLSDGEDTTDQGRVALEDSTDKEEPEESKVDEKKSKEDKKRKIVAKKAAETANQIASAVTLEQQRDLQNRLIALIGYNPSFADYQTMINGGYIPDAQGYEETKVPESRRGLRNGLAQQILHEKMVEMQYAR